MATCSVCDTQTSMPFTCKFCEESFCSAHRLPENHDCDGLEQYKEQSHEEGKVGYDVTTNDAAEPEVTSRARQRSLAARVSSALPSPGGHGRNLPLTYILLGVMFVVFFLQVSLCMESGRTVCDSLALFPGDVMAQPWSLVTSMFLHGGTMHLLVNSIVLFSFGKEIEKMLGDRKYLGLIFAAGLASSIGFALSGVLFNMTKPAVGISGALFGLVAFLAVVRPSTRVLAFFVIPLKIRTAVAGFALFDVLNLLIQILNAAGMVSISGLYGLLFPGLEVASSGHLSGLLIGLLYGYHVQDRFRQRRSPGMPHTRRLRFTRF